MHLLVPGWPCNRDRPDLVCSLACQLVSYIKQAGIINKVLQKAVNMLYVTLSILSGISDRCTTITNLIKSQWMLDKNVPNLLIICLHYLRSNTLNGPSCHI